MHTGFQSDLQQACSGSKPASGSIPECFMKWKSEFLIYGDFCSNLPRAQDRVDEVCKNGLVLQSMEVGKVDFIPWISRACHTS